MVDDSRGSLGALSEKRCPALVVRCGRRMSVSTSHIIRLTVERVQTPIATNPRSATELKQRRETLASSAPIRPDRRAALFRSDPPLQVVRGTDWPLGVTDATLPVHGRRPSSDHGLQSNGPQFGTFGASGWNAKPDAGDGHGSNLRFKYLARFVTELGPYATGDCPVDLGRPIRRCRRSSAIRERRDRSRLSVGDSRCPTTRNENIHQGPGPLGSSGSASIPPRMSCRPNAQR